jgi:uncharacterized membrane protein (DUF2068 family)
VSTRTEERERRPPGTERPARWMPRFHYELISCGLRGHTLVGLDAERVRPEDELLVREPGDGLRWHRCVRCDAWVPLAPPVAPTRPHPPDRDQIELPLRGRPLRDLYVLRLIAIDRIVHFVVLAALAVGVVVFISDRAAIGPTFYAVLDAIQGGVGGPNGMGGTGILAEAEKAFTVSPTTLWVIAAVLALYALLEGVEAIGLWRCRRWAEYLTFIATTLLLLPEIYELLGTITATKIVALVVNLAVVAYLLFAKRLFGLRGGGRAVAAEHARDSGWQALQMPRPAAAT